MCFWEYLLTEYPNGLYGENGDDWDYKILSKHICFKCIRKFNHKPWSPVYISSRSDLPFHDIFETADYKIVLDLGSCSVLTLDRWALGHNGNAPWDFVKEYEDGIFWNPHVLARNPNLPFEDLEAKHEDSDDLFLNRVLSNRSLHLDFVEKNVGFCIKSRDQMKKLSGNPIVTEEFVSKYPDGLNGFPWSLTKLASHLPVDFIANSKIFSLGNMDHRLKRKMLDVILLNPSVTEEFLEANLAGISNINKFLQSPLMTPEKFVSLFANEYWPDRQKLSYAATHKNFPLRFFEEKPKINSVSWDLDDICKNPNLTWDFVETHTNGFLGQRWSSKALSHQKWETHNAERRFRHQKGIL